MKLIRLIFVVIVFIFVKPQMSFADELKANDRVECANELNFETESLSFELVQESDLNQLSYIFSEVRSPKYKDITACNIVENNIENVNDALSYLVKIFEDRQNKLIYSIRSKKVMTYPLIGLISIGFSDYVENNIFTKKEAQLRLFLEACVDQEDIYGLLKDVVCIIVNRLFKFREVGRVVIEGLDDRFNNCMAEALAYVKNIC